MQEGTISRKWTGRIDYILSILLLCAPLLLCREVLAQEMPGRSEGLTYNPGILNLGSVEVGRAVLDTIEIVWEPEDSIRITSLRLTQGIYFELQDISLPFYAFSRKPVSVVVRFQANVAATIRDSLVVSTATWSDTIPLVAETRPPVKGLTVTPPTIDFGTIPVDVMVLDSVVIRNETSSTITITNLTLPSAPFFCDTTQLGERRLLPAEKRTLYVRCRTADSGCWNDQLILTDNGGGENIIRVAACTDLPLGVSGLDTIYRLHFGPRPLNSRTILPLKLVLRSATQTPVRLIALSPTKESEGIRLLDQVQQGTTITSDTSYVQFEFQPGADQIYTATYQGVTDKGRFLVELDGIGTDMDLSPDYHYSLDSVEGDVGTRLSGLLRVDSLIREPDYGGMVDSLLVRLRYNPAALIPDGVDQVNNGLTPKQTELKVFSPSEAELVLRITINPANAPDIRKTIVDLNWIGLSTGQPVNRVEGIITTYGVKMTTVDSVDGIVLLHGCTVGLEPFSAKIALRSATIDPRSGILHLEYRPPAGSVGLISISDVEGREQELLRAENGSGAWEQAEIPLDGFTPGLYFVRLYFGDDQITIPVMRQ